MDTLRRAPISDIIRLGVAAAIYNNTAPTNNDGSWNRIQVNYQVKVLLKLRQDGAN